ncbi:MAG: site-specific tyrosine recombinase/integron integrase [Psychroflexus sp.]|uniref:site-specific tyrosine recombinase/integron integrase n=1 Tax=Psychroflexus sp. S27 TaxID=1982757 RepID=UPI000C2A45B7|nr:site-specific tyrosine recombinase/integron integrase [Psychroflexus sp. S27]PJX23902.1 tyrosine recombinase XerD [Psychroflexus sp. S27]
MHWQSAINSFKNYLKIERGLLENTVNSYILDVEKLVKYLAVHEIEVGPKKISTEDLRSFIYELSKVVNERTQARILSGLRSFFDFLVFDEVRDDNPVLLIESPKIGRKLPDTLSVEEIDEIVAAIDLSHPQGQRNKTIIETLYGCGLRVSELINLRLSDLFFDEGFISIVGKGEKQRFVPLNDYTQHLIEIYINDVRRLGEIANRFEDVLFLNRRGKQLTRAMIFTIVRKFSEEANLDKKISPHTFRHSYATHLLENGADLRAIQQILGHESITTTEVYIHLNQTHLRDTIEQFHPRA